jgi:catechol 2,3-dioxygenase-like lactoylglutathione lyase family enzyme
MQLLRGINHVAVLTADLDRFIEFYQRVFGLEVIFSESTTTFRHAILRTGPDSWLHPAEIANNSHATAVPAMFLRGHLDHLALTAASQEAFMEIRARLMVSGASTGSIEDLGAFHGLWFEDPDGMRAELIVIVDPTLVGVHAPKPLGPSMVAQA